VGKPGMKRLRVKGQYNYEAWQEMAHAARSVRAVAREYLPGSAHTTTAAVVMTAFSVEAFCQTLGPAILGAEWKDRSTVKDKIKAIARKVGLKADFGASPWSDVQRLMEARDAHAHAKPHAREIDSVVEVEEDVDARELLNKEMQRHYLPLHDLDELDRVADAIEAALLEIWTAAGRRAVEFKRLSRQSWSVSLLT